MSLNYVKNADFFRKNPRSSKDEILRKNCMTYVDIKGFNCSTAERKTFDHNMFIETTL